LQPAFVGMRQAWVAEALHQQRAERSQAIVASREYGFVLFPEKVLTDFLLPILENSGGGG